MDLFQVLEYVVHCYHFYNKEFIDKEDYKNVKLLLRINNNFYNSICNIYNIVMLLYSINLITFSFIFVNNIQNIKESFIHGMFLYLVIVGFVFFSLFILGIILLISTCIFFNRLEVNTLEINRRVLSVRRLLDSFIPNGLSSEIINKIKRSYEPLENNCSICLNKENKEIMILNCNHNFHSECLLRWFINNKKCPICRKEVTNNDYTILVPL